MKRRVIAALTFTVLVAAAGCSETSTFKVVFANRLPVGHDIDCYVNGKLLGTVAPTATGEFSWETRYLGTYTSGDRVASAAVVFAARDRSTGILSHEIPRTIWTDRTEYVEINVGDF